MCSFCVSDHVTECAKQNGNGSVLQDRTLANGTRDAIAYPSIDVALYLDRSEKHLHRGKALSCSTESESPRSKQWRLQQWDTCTACKALSATALQSCGLVWRLVFECQVCVALHCTLLHSSLPIVRCRSSLQFATGSSSLCCRPAATASAPSYTRGHGRCKWSVEVSLVLSVLLNLLKVGETL
jgi:hypothetical protein